MKNSNTNSNTELTPPAILKFAALTLMIIIVSCLAYSFSHQPPSFKTFLTGTIGTFLFYSVTMQMFLERHRYQTTCKLFEKSSKEREISPPNHKTRASDTIKALAITTLGFGSMFYLFIIVEPMNRMVLYLLSGSIGVSLYLIIHTGFTYRWLRYKCFGA
jgi:hypothetical protein